MVDKVQKICEEPVNEDLEEAADNAFNIVLNNHEIVNLRSCMEMFKYGAQWQKEQMMAKAIDCEVHQTNVAGIKLDSVEICSDGIMLDNTLYKEGDKVKVIVIKED